MHNEIVLAKEEIINGIKEHDAAHANKEEVKKTQMCPNCDRVYDESGYWRCPYCSGGLEMHTGERYYKTCLNCDGIMYWDGEWECTNRGETIGSDEDDNDGIIEG